MPLSPMKPPTNAVGMIAVTLDLSNLEWLLGGVPGQLLHCEGFGFLWFSLVFQKEGSQGK